MGLKLIALLFGINSFDFFVEISDIFAVMSVLLKSLLVTSGSDYGSVLDVFGFRGEIPMRMYFTVSNSVTIYAVGKNYQAQVCSGLKTVNGKMISVYRSLHIRRRTE